MRDEDLKSLPQTLESWKVREFLEALGFCHSDVYELRVTPMDVTVSVYRTDAAGRRYKTEPDGPAAKYEYLADLDQVWDRPKGALEDPEDEVRDCEAWEAQDGEVVQCALLLGHDGGHSYRLHTGRVLGDAPQA